MARELTAWGCAFRCGRRIILDRRAMERHERTCFCNPARRACKTCRYESKPVGERRDCDHPDGAMELDETLDIRWDCPHWAAKEHADV